MHDAVVIGAGPNGLVAANLLADEGWDVLVLEAAATPGGAVRTAELIEPGYSNDVCSAFYPLAAASPVMTKLELERHGLVWKRAPLVLAHPAADGTCPVISTDIDVTAASLDELHQGDGDAWRAMFGEWERAKVGLLASLFTGFPPVLGGLRLAASLRGDLLEFTRSRLLPVRRFGEERFGSEGARRLLAGSALHADLAPEAVLSGFFGWLMSCLGQDVGFPVPEGGAQHLTGALVRRFEAGGGELHCGEEVTSVVVRDGVAVGVRTAGGDEVRAERAVIADVSAPALYLRLVGAEHLPSRVVDALHRFQWDHGTVKVDWNLDGPIPWSAEAARRAGTVHVAEGVDALTVGASELARGLVPATPFLVVGQQQITDTTRQPAGKETAWAYTHVPQQIRGDAGGRIAGQWDDAESQVMADRMQAEIERLAPGFGSLVRGRHVLTPIGFGAENQNLVNGAIGGGTSELHQQLVFRPIPGLGRPETPVRRLYLGSASAHPGGGLHGASGSNAARAAIAGDRRRRTFGAVRRMTGGRAGPH